MNDEKTPNADWQKEINIDDELNDISRLLNNANSESKEINTNKDDIIRSGPHGSHHRSHSSHSRRHHRKHRRSKKTVVIRVLIIILCVLLSILIAAGITLFCLYKSGEGALKPSPDAQINIKNKNIMQQDDLGRVIDYKGKRYVFNEDMINILVMGVDRDTLGTDGGVIGTAGQADSIFMVSLDLVAKKYTVINISRDTYTDIGVYSAEGKYIGTEKHQLCLSYAYGDGKESSCENTLNAVSALLYNIPINKYYSIEKSAIPLMNDAIGGVTVPVFDENGEQTGKTTHLMGHDAYDYIHFRDITKLDSNNVRMKRQIAYLRAFSDKIITETKKDLGVPLALFNTSAEYASTNLDAPAITYLATNVIMGGKVDVEFASLKGSVEKDENGLARYIVDQDALTDLVVKTYYKPAQ